VVSKAAMLARSLRPAWVARRDDDVGPLGAGEPGGFETDAGAPPDHDDGLAEQVLLALRW
jgi:hypothetical protein